MIKVPVNYINIKKCEVDNTMFQWIDVNFEVRADCINIEK